MYSISSSHSVVSISAFRRHGLGEERDPYRLKDGKGASVLCYHCGMSALPESPPGGVPLSQLRGSMATKPSTDGWRTMVSCDFCPLHWHLDCLDPPLSCLPPLSKKWRCPNHASNITVRILAGQSGISCSIFFSRGIVYRKRTTPGWTLRQVDNQTTV